MAHAGDPKTADSQIYITLAPQPRLDDKHVVFGQVITGLPLTDQIAEGDVIKKMYVKGGGTK